jgi:hypothetical protein
MFCRCVGSGKVYGGADGAEHPCARRECVEVTFDAAHESMKQIVLYEPVCTGKTGIFERRHCNCPTGLGSD